MFAHQLIRLDQLGLIRIVPGRTGRQYVKGLRDPELADCAQATLALFESVYYGHRVPSSEAFERVWQLRTSIREPHNRAGHGGAAMSPGRGRDCTLAACVAGTLRVPWLLSISASRDRALATLAAAAFLIIPGCGRGPTTDYGMSHGTSLNGTQAFAAMLRARGNEVRAAIRLDETVGDWADGLVRFAAHPGPPSKEEADWFREWLAADSERWLIYVVRDFDAQAEYWKEVRDAVAQSNQADAAARRDLAEEKRAEAADWVAKLPPRESPVADARDWFAVDTAWEPPRVCTTLGGPWALGVDATAAGLTVHEPLKPLRGRTLLEADGKPFVVERSNGKAANMLLFANGSFLLNEALAHPARRALADQVVAWIGEPGEKIGMIEGAFVMAGDLAMPTIWDLLGRLASMRYAAIHLGIAGLIAAWARAPRLGRPRPDEPSGADRPAAHAEALGALFARSRASGLAHATLDRYRRWRFPRAAHDNDPGPSSQPHPTSAPAAADRSRAGDQPATMPS